MEGKSSEQYVAALFALFIVASFPISAFAAQIPNAEFIRNSCRITRYPKLCFSSLSSHASNIQKSPKLLAKTALSVTLETMKSASASIARMSRGVHEMNSREAAAVRDCMEMLRDASDEVRKSLGEMKNLQSAEFALAMSNIQTWVSAALTNEDTCTDGFSDDAMNGNVKTAVRGWMVNATQTTSNALALINGYASCHGLGAPYR